MVSPEGGLLSRVCATLPTVHNPGGQELRTARGGAGGGGGVLLVWMKMGDVSTGKQLVYTQKKLLFFVCLFV